MSSLEMLVTLEELLKDRGIQFVRSGEHHHATKHFINMDCPFCSPDTKRYRLGFNVIHKYFHCWACGHLNKIDCLCSLLNITRTEAKQALQLLRINDKYTKTDNQTKTQNRQRQVVLPQGLLKTLLPQHKQYLEKRKLDPNEIARIWRVTGTGAVSSIPWRLFIPVYENRTLVNWTSRSINNNAVSRYISAKNDQCIISLKSLLYGEDYCSSTIIICEGPVDVWKIGPGAVATFGVQVTKEQIIKISKYPTRVICFDNEKEGQKAATKLLKDLALLPGTTINVKLSSKDPGEASQEELEELRKFLVV